jgi:Protein of unknown function (DUF1569)
MHAELEAVCDRFQQALAGIDGRLAQVHPGNDPQRWNTQQIVEHLLLTYRNTSEALERRLQKGTATRVSATWTQRIAKTAVLRLRYLPPGRKSPESVAPKPGVPRMDGAELSLLMRSELAAMDTLLCQCEQHLGHVPLQAHFAFGPLTAAQWRRFHAIHAAHHLKQIRRLRRELVTAA